MLRECNLSDISDGKMYGLNDMVKADSGAAPDAINAAPIWLNPSFLTPMMFICLKTGWGRAFRNF